MTTFVWMMRIPIFFLTLLPMFSYAKKSSNRRGSIARALESPADTTHNPFKQNFPMASLDRFPLADPIIKEGSFIKEKGHEDEQISPIDRELSSASIAAKEKDREKELSKETISQYELPTELQEKAKSALKTVETKQQDE